MQGEGLRSRLVRETQGCTGGACDRDTRIGRSCRENTGRGACIYSDLGLNPTTDVSFWRRTWGVSPLFCYASGEGRRTGRRRGGAYPTDTRVGGACVRWLARWPAGGRGRTTAVLLVFGGYVERPCGINSPTPKDHVSSWAAAPHGRNGRQRRTAAAGGQPRDAHSPPRQAVMGLEKEAAAPHDRESQSSNVPHTPAQFRRGLHPPRPSRSLRRLDTLFWGPPCPLLDCSAVRYRYRSP